MIYISGIISLIIQFIVGIIDYLAINLKVDSKDEILKDLLKLEVVVQIIEFIFYVWLIFYFNSLNITPFRYLDWAITTPLMLITLSAFLKHDGNTKDRLSDFLFKHKDSVVKIVVLNAGMLLCGLLGEFGYLSAYTAAALGFIPFVLNFKYIKDTFLPSSKSDENKNKKRIFIWFVFFWSLYGVFSTMSYITKNTGYNILDIFAKNFFGLFLAYVIKSKST